MTISVKRHNKQNGGHRIIIALVLCLFGFFLISAISLPRDKQP